MIATFLWLYVKGAHWIWGALIIAGILIFDPIWRIMGRNIIRMIQKNNARGLKPERYKGVHFQRGRTWTPLSSRDI